MGSLSPDPHTVSRGCAKTGSKVCQGELLRPISRLCHINAAGSGVGALGNTTSKFASCHDVQDQSWLDRYSSGNLLDNRGRSHKRQKVPSTYNIPRRVQKLVLPEDHQGLEPLTRACERGQDHWWLQGAASLHQGCSLLPISHLEL